MPKILLVEDDMQLARELLYELNAEGWVTEHAGCARDAEQLLQFSSFDLIILDWTLPDGTGFEICSKFRQDSGTTPVIFLTGQHSIDEKEAGFEAGADDYLTKPFLMRELKARIKSILRRPPTLLPLKLVVNGAFLDSLRRQLIKGDIVVQLSQTECRLLQHLMTNSDRHFSSADLFKAIWISDSDSTEQTVRQHISVLRKKLQIAGLPDYLITVRGLGYRVVPNQSE